MKATAQKVEDAAVLLGLDLVETVAAADGSLEAMHIKAQRAHSVILAAQKLDQYGKTPAVFTSFTDDGVNLLESWTATGIKIVDKRTKKPGTNDQVS